jgi:antitoxin MazE
MTTRIRKWGNSLGLRIPRHCAREAGIKAGAEVDLSVRNGRLVVRPSRPAKYALHTLLAAVTPANLHGEANVDRATGREMI